MASWIFPDDLHDERTAAIAVMAAGGRHQQKRSHRNPGAEPTIVTPQELFSLG
jgi:hypothetical protein